MFYGAPGGYKRSHQGDPKGARVTKTSFGALGYKLLENIVMIWTPKTMKKSAQTSQEEEATKTPPEKAQKARGTPKWVLQHFWL